MNTMKQKDDIEASLYRVEYTEDGKTWRLWKNDMTLADAKALSARIETRETRVIIQHNVPEHAPSPAGASAETEVKP